MANRSLAAKAARAARQSREAGAFEGTKAAYLMAPSKDETRALLASLEGAMREVHVVKCAKGKPVPAVGKGGRTEHSRTYGDGRRRGAALTLDCFVW